MKHLILATALSALAFGVAAADPELPAGAKSIVPNCDFAAPTMKPWQTSVTSGKFEFAAEEAEGAKNGKVLRITCTAPDDKGEAKIWGRAYQPVKVVKGIAYRAKVRFKTLPGFSGKFEFWIRSGNGKDANRTLTASAKDGWRELAGRLVPGQDEAVFYLTITKGTGTVLVDEVIVTPFEE